MLKEQERSFGNMQKILDVVVVLLSWSLAFFIRFKIMKGGEPDLEFLFLKLSFVLSLFTHYHLLKSNLYHSQRFTHRYKEIFSIVKGNTLASVAFILFLYFFGFERVSRLALIFYFSISTLALIIVRMILRNFLRSLRRKGKNLRHILLIGSGTPLKDYVKNTRTFKDSGIRFLGWIDSAGLAEEFNVEKIEKSYREIKLKPDAIVISYSGADSHKVEEFVAQNHDDIVPIQILPDLSYSLIGHKIEDFGGIPLLTVNQPSLSLFGLFLKRTIDFFGSFLGLIILSPLLMIISALVKSSSPGPIFYGQERLGLNGETFLMWKFRTMKLATTGEDQTEWSSKENPRKTKLGDFLRKTSLDELPQLWNVLLGNMSLIGPRPERPFFVEKFRKEIPGYMLRHKMRAGITGWAQVNGWRGDTSLHKRIDCDIYYIKNWSLWFDFKILFLTFFKGFINKNAY